MLSPPCIIVLTAHKNFVLRVVSYLVPIKYYWSDLIVNGSSHYHEISIPRDSLYQVTPQPSLVKPCQTLVLQCHGDAHWAMDISLTPLETLGLLAFLRGQQSVLPPCLVDLPSKLETSLQENAHRFSLADFGLFTPVKHNFRFNANFFRTDLLNPCPRQVLILHL